MKKTYFTAICAMAFLTLISCGGNGSNGSNDFSTDGLYGELPGMYMEYRQILYDGIEKMKGANASNIDQVKSEFDADKDAYIQRIVAAGNTIKGKEIFVEIGEGVPFKVVKAPVIGETRVGGIEMTNSTTRAELESTDEIAVGKEVDGKFNRDTSLRIVAVDKNGTPLLYRDKRWGNITPSPTDDVMDPSYINYMVPAGSTGSLAIILKYENIAWKMERASRIDHYVVVLKDSELGKQAEESMKHAKEEAKKQAKE